MRAAEKLRLVVGGIIVGVWVAAFIADAFIPGYDVPVSVHGAMMLVAGYLFGPAITGRQRQNGDGE